jgi:murein DD-endopeptidase / murein LD-carboxypeptidase
LKLALSLFIFFLFFTSCKPTLAIITSKKEAEKKGIYVAPIAKKTIKKKDILSVQKEKEITQKTKISQINEVDYQTDSSNSTYLVEQLINSASNKIGSRYKSGGTTDEGFDCSGLMYNIFNLYDIKLPRSSFEQSKIGTSIERESIQKGDLIFFRTNGRNQINHVGMVVEILEDEIKFIHSSTSSGVIISSTKEPYYQKSFAQVNRVLE